MSVKKKDVWNGIKQCCISNPISHVFSSFSVKMWFQENIFFKSNIVEHEITKKYHKEQLNMNYNLTAVCFCVLNTLIFSHNIIKAFNHLMTMQQKMSIETLSIEKLWVVYIFQVYGPRTLKSPFIERINIILIYYFFL